MRWNFFQLSYDKALSILCNTHHQVVKELRIFIFPTLHTGAAQASSGKFHFWKVIMEKRLQDCFLKIDFYPWAGHEPAEHRALPLRGSWFLRLSHYFFSSLSVSFIASVIELIKMQPFSKPLQNTSSDTHTYLFQSISVSPAWLRTGCYRCALHLLF